MALFVGQVQAAPTLTYFEENFIIRNGSVKVIAPLKLLSTSPKLVSPFRKDNTFAVWDDRGLSIRHAGNLRSTTFPDFLTSPKAFTRAEIKKNIADLAAGHLHRRASALSGAQRIGDHVYFLVRWDRRGSPAYEGLFRINLRDKPPVPQFIARAHALSGSTHAIDENLFVWHGNLAYFASRPDRWGLVELPKEGNHLRFTTLGNTLLTIHRTDQQQVVFTETTVYDTTIAGSLSMDNLRRKILCEGRTRMRFADQSSTDFVVLSTSDGAVLQNTWSGIQTRLPSNSSLRVTAEGVVVWSPISSPTQAWLLDRERLATLATWRRGGQEKPRSE